MKKSILLLFFLFCIIFSSFTVDHYLGSSINVSRGFLVIIPAYFDTTISIDHNAMFKEFFSLENQFFLGYSYFVGIERNRARLDGLNITYQLSPIFHFGNYNFKFFFTTPSFKMQFNIYYYRDYDKKYKLIKEHFINLPYFLIGFGSKFGLNIYLGNARNIIFTPIYFNLDAFIYVNCRLLSFQAGGGLCIKFLVGSS